MVLFLFYHQFLVLYLVVFSLIIYRIEKIKIFLNIIITLYYNNILIIYIYIYILLLLLLKIVGDGLF